MERLKKFFKKCMEYPRAFWWVQSGQAERDRQEALRQLDDLQQRVQKTLEEAKDYAALSEFRTRKAAEYFNEAAARQPDMAEEYGRLARLAATVDLGKMRGSEDAYLADEADNREWHRVRERFADEINRYAGTKIGEFITQDPERWQRIEKNCADKAAKLKPPG